jgi:hypothetical protein
MGASAILMLVVSLVVVPGGLAASAVFLALRPEVPAYPPLPPGMPD